MPLSGCQKRFESEPTAEKPGHLITLHYVVLQHNTEEGRLGGAAGSRSVTPRSK